MKSDFDIQFNHDGEWHDALVSTPKDANNVSLWYVADNGQLQFVADASRGNGSGQFRDKE
jgi:hypothetical protein